jgi:hypothetical protein
MKRPQIIVIANALLWAAVILAVDTILGNSAYASRVLLVLGGGSAGSLILLGGLLGQKAAAR